MTLEGNFKPIQKQIKTRIEAAKITRARRLLVEAGHPHVLWLNEIARKSGNAQFLDKRKKKRLVDAA